MEEIDTETMLKSVIDPVVDEYVDVFDRQMKAICNHLGPPFNDVPSLPDEVWTTNIFSSDLLTAYRGRALSKTLRLDLEENVIRPRFGFVLNCGSPVVNQGRVQELFCLSVDEARRLPHTQHRLGRYAIEHRFRVFKVHRLLQERLGPVELRRRITTRETRKRKRAEGEEDLPQRKRKAAETRLASLSGAIRAAKLGDSLEVWATALAARADDDAVADPLTNYYLKSYLADDVLKPPVTLKAVIEEVKAMEARYSTERIADRAQIASLKQKRCDDLRAALSALKLQRRSDSALCDAYERGRPIGGFNTPEMVAAQMAWMHWLHNYTIYTHRLRDCVEELRDDAGHYYDGINADARDEVQHRSEFQPPPQWPWM